MKIIHTLLLQLQFRIAIIECIKNKDETKILKNVPELIQNIITVMWDNIK